MNTYPPHPSHSFTPIKPFSVEFNPVSYEGGYESGKRGDKDDRLELMLGLRNTLSREFPASHLVPVRHAWIMGCIDGLGDAGWAKGDRMKPHVDAFLEKYGTLK